MSLTDIIALIGCCTGSISFVLSLFLFLRERTKLKIIYNNDVLFTLDHADKPFVDKEGCSVEAYSKDNCLLAIRLLITNVSKNPTTIYQIVLNKKHIITSSSETANNFPISFDVIDGHLLSRNYFSFKVRGIKPLIRLEPYSSIEGCIVFNNLSYSFANSKKIKITVKSVQTNKSISFKPNYIKFSINE